MKKRIGKDRRASKASLLHIIERLQACDALMWTLEKMPQGRLHRASINRLRTRRERLAKQVTLAWFARM